MNLPDRWYPRFWKRNLPAAPSADVCFDAAPASGLADLQTRLNHWSHLWTHENEAPIRTEAQQLVSERLDGWMEHCFGRNVLSSFRSKGTQISLASSTPIFTAFLGRRATRELSRRVLQDI
jgi:hypothetical protein